MAATKNDGAKKMNIRPRVKNETVVTPEMLRAAQIRSELGAYVCANLSGGYSMIEDMFKVMVDAAPASVEQELLDVKAGIPARDAEIAALRKENAELREQLEAVGAGGVNGRLMPGAVSAEPVAYLDLGAGGYMDVGTDLTDEQLAALPKGRHMLAIVGTYGVEGFTAAPVAAQAQQQAIGMGATPRNSEILDLAVSEGMTAKDGVYCGSAATILCFAGALTRGTALAQQDADKVDAWQCTTTLQESDDLIWLYCQDTNTIDGPVKSSPEFIDAWTHWAWVEYPSTAAIDAARKEQA